ncbi:MAG: hypothetical protein AB7O73_03175 [Bacteroidia bacterium]
MTKISIILFTFLSYSLISQTPDKIKVKAQSQIFFFRINNPKDSMILPDESDLFFINFSEDKKDKTEIKISNANLLRTNKENLYKLVYMPGMKYRFIFQEALKTTNTKSKNELNPVIEVDGTTENKELIQVDIVKYPELKSLITYTYVPKK